MTEQEAIDFLEAQNALGATLTWDSVPEASTTVPVGDVIRTTPAFGEFVRPDEYVLIYVSSGPAATLGFPVVSQFGGLLQGVNG